MGCGGLAHDRASTGVHQSGDRNGLGSLMEAHRPGLVRYAEGILGDVGGGEDVVQEVFLRLWRRREELGAKEPASNLLYTATRNAAIDERRRRARQVAVVSRVSSRPPGPSPLDAVEANEMRAAAAKAIAGLPPRRQQIFRLRCLRGMAHREIATAMDISTQTVANQMTHALRSLRAALGMYDVPAQ